MDVFCENFDPKNQTNEIEKLVAFSFTFQLRLPSEATQPKNPSSVRANVGRDSACCSSPARWSLAVTLTT